MIFFLRLLCNSGGSLREAPNASPNQSFHWRTRTLKLSQQHPRVVACGSTPVTSALPFQPPPPSSLPAESSMWCTTTLQRHGEKIDLKAVGRSEQLNLQMLLLLLRIAQVSSVTGSKILPLSKAYIFIVQLQFTNGQVVV